MSAFLIDQVNYRKFAVAFKYATNRDVEESVNELYQTNVKAVNFRYKENNEIEEWKPLTDNVRFISDVRIKCSKLNRFHLMAKLNDFIDTAVYQCSEGAECRAAAVEIAYTLKRRLNDIIFIEEEIHDFGDFNL